MNLNLMRNCTRALNEMRKELILLLLSFPISYICGEFFLGNGWGIAVVEALLLGLLVTAVAMIFIVVVHHFFHLLKQV